MRKLIAMIGLACITSGAFSQARDKCHCPTMAEYEGVYISTPVYDTVRTVIMSFTKLPGLVFVKFGYAVMYKNRCVSHLDNKRQVFKTSTHVASCGFNNHLGQFMKSIDRE